MSHSPISFSSGDELSEKARDCGRYLRCAVRLFSLLCPSTFRMWSLFSIIKRQISQSHTSRYTDARGTQPLWVGRKKLIQFPTFYTLVFRLGVVRGRLSLQISLQFCAQWTHPRLIYYQLGAPMIHLTFPVRKTKAASLQAGLHTHLTVRNGRRVY